MDARSTKPVQDVPAVHGQEPIWFDAVAAPTFPRLQGKLGVDVAIVGGGITGLLTALLLKRAGMRVAVLEARRIAKGVTGRTTAKVSVAQSGVLQKIGDADLARAYIAANVAGQNLLRELASELAPGALELVPALLYAAQGPEEQQLAEEVALLRAADVKVEPRTDAGLPAERTAAAARVPAQAQIQPYELLVAVAAAIDGDGSHVFERSPVLQLHAGRSRRWLDSDIGRVHADHVVLACHMPFPIRGLVFAKAFPYMGYAVAMETSADRVIEAIHIPVGDQGNAVRWHRAGGDRAFAIVSGEGHKVGSDQHTRERYRRLIDWGSSVLDIEPRATRCWSTHDLRSADHVPFVGRLSRAAPGVYLATGYGGWGMTNGAAAAIALRDLLHGNDTPFDGVYDALRTTRVVRGVGKLTVENAKVAAQYASDPFEGTSEVRPSQLAAGAGGVLRLDSGRRVAAARDLDGTLHVLSPRCTHMGCLVKFNDADRTWDCPCHGSRFAIDGNVLYGPAVDALRRYAVVNDEVVEEQAEPGSAPVVQTPRVRPVPASAPAGGVIPPT